MQCDIKNLRVAYGQNKVIRDLSFQIPSGQTYCLLGRNGSGRTTTAKAILGDLKYEGDILIEGSSVKNFKTHEIALLGIGYVSENRDIFPELTLEENLLLGQKKDNTPSELSTDELFDRTPDLARRKKVRGKNLSGGEKQLLAIYRTLLGNPSFLILDEPTEGISPKVFECIEDLFEKFKEKNLSILLIDQKLSLSLKVANKVGVIGEGRILFEGTPESLKERPEIINSWLGLS